MCEHSNGWRPEDGLPDLAMISDITDQGININLRTRYKRDQIYTFSGSILIAVNPYKPLDIYNQDWIVRYRDQKLDQTDPHIFALAEAMYMNLVMQDYNEDHDNVEKSSIQQPSRNFSCPNTKNQACVISGESGAGKTETTKFILSYLCSVTPNKSTWMEHQILEANTILEAFGNAKTVRNDNSSRFGKFIQICFDSHYQINGCIIQDYLLEQSRITYQSIDERNYHVFYQLVAAGQTNQELRRKFHLMPANFYDYLNQTQCYIIDGINDCAMFDSLRTAMSVLNMERESCDGVFGVLSAILWLGNLQFRCDEKSQNEQCQFTENDEEIIKIIVELLNVEKVKLESIMLRRQINVRGTITEIPFRVHEARDNRNGIAKSLYSRLFTWMVNFINASTNPGLDNTCFMGVLDIFGFENFETNSFEQLCINYANEKLHKFFNHHMFAMEQELYQREGIEFCDINYTDNTPCLELLERPPNCILRILSEECRIPKGSDSTFIEKLHSEFSTNNPHPYYIKGSDKRNWSTEFAIKHFAGSVNYNIKGFLKKNKDTQHGQLSDILGSSTYLILRDLVDCQNFSRASSSKQESMDSISSRNSLSSINSFVKPKLQSQQSLCFDNSISNSSNQGSRIRRESSFTSGTMQTKNNNVSYSNSSSKSKQTVVDVFRQQLSSLVDLLSSVNPWYVRCIKPNFEKSATDYNDKQVLLQLKYLGMSDLIRIRREGYPIHLTKHQFVCRYRCLMLKHLRTHPKISPIGLDDSSLENYCVRMMHYFELNPKDWKIGKTMVLLRSNIHQPLEEKRNELFVNMATLIQSSWRSYRNRKHFNMMKTAASRIQETFRAYRGRLFYLRKKRAVLTIQAYVRGMFAREIANALREIKRADKEKARKLAIEEKERREFETRRQENDEAEESKSLPERKGPHRPESVRNNCLNIVITEASDASSSCDTERIVDIKTDRNMLDSSPAYSSPNSNNSPAVSSSTSWIGQDLDSTENRSANNRDRQEMEELVKVLDRHGISLDEPTNDGEGLYADFEKLYDVLGNQLNINNCDARSISTSVNDEDKCSFATSGTNCDGDSISCSGQSVISSTMNDDQTCGEEGIVSAQSIESDQNCSDSTGDNTVNLNKRATIENSDDGKYQSNSIESIESIVSSTSAQLSTPSELQQVTASTVIAKEQADTIAPSVDETHAPRKSTFTGNSIIVAGSKLVSNGRPLTRIEEEPNSANTSPSKTPFKKRMDPSSQKPTSLFEPQENDDNEQVRANQCNEFKKRRLERKILQVQQEQLIHPINPTTAGLPVANTQTMNQAQSNAINNNQQNSQKEINDKESAGSDSIYGVRKCNIIEYAEQIFNDHLRDLSNGQSMIKTLTRRRRSVDTTAGEYLTKAEMLSYNPSFVIPTSHIKMHDPHNVQISCSMFKNLCKYMTGESAKNDTEVRIIQSIVRNGIEKIELRDEIYVQIIRQLTNNPNHEYCLRLWVLLGLASGAFPASKIFSKYLIPYIQSKPKKDPSINCHAQFCLDNLQAIRLNIRKYPPSTLEIQACKKLTNLKCKVHLLDGRCETVSVHPCDTALDTLTKLAHRIDLQSIEGWALYESYTPGTSKYPHPLYEQKGDIERSVKARYFMADLLACWQDGSPKKVSTTTSLKLAQKRIEEGGFKLTLKKRIFRGPKIRNDPTEISLLYSQAVYNVVKKDSFLVDESLALTLAGLQAQALLGNAVDPDKQDGDGKKGKSIKQTKIQSNKQPQNIYDIDNYICQRLRSQTTRSKKEWSILIAQSHKQFQNVNEVFCKMRYLSMVIYHCPLYGTATFRVVYKGFQDGLDQNLILGINAEGLVLINSSDRALITACRYSDICATSGVTVYADENIIQINIKDKANNVNKCFSFETLESEEISLLMLSYSTNLNVNMRGATNNHNYTLDPSFDINATKRKSKLKMTLEDRMRTHQEVQNARKAIVRSGKLRKQILEDGSSGLLKHTLRRLSSNKPKTEKTSRFENIYGTLTRSGSTKHDIQKTISDNNIYGSAMNANQAEQDLNSQSITEVSGATASTVVDEVTKAYPHRYWAYTNLPLKASLLIIYDTELEEAALANFYAILTYSGLVSYQQNEVCVSTQDTGSMDSGIASHQSLAHSSGKMSGGSPSSSSSGDIYDVCPKKIDEKDLLKLAQGILDRCLKKDADILKNEFFLQLIKQTTDHPDPNSEINQRHWQLLALACSVTYPSDCKILSYLFAHLRRCSLDQVTDEGQYAQFTLRSLQGTLDTKGRRLAPSEMEILSTINCRRVYARVYFLDGQFQAVEFDPCATIAEVVEQIKQKIGLRAGCGGYALFQPLDDDSEQVLQPEEKVGDAIAYWESWQKQKQMKMDLQVQSQNAQSSISKLSNKASLASLNATNRSKSHKFVFKKYLFLDSLIDLSDPVERELLYYQTVTSIREDKFPVLEQEATILCALRAQIEIGDYTKLTNLPREHLKMIYKQVIMSLMPPHLYNDLPILAIAQQHQAFRDLSCVDTKKYFFNLIQTFGRASFSNNPGYILLHRAHIYDATQTFATAWPSEIWIVINQIGMHMLVAKSRRVLASCEYCQILDYNSNNNYLMVIVLINPQNRIKYTFYTKQAQQIAQQMKDYTVINSSTGNKRRKSVGFNLKHQKSQTDRGPFSEANNNSIKC